MEAEEAVVRAYYERGEERERLADGRGQLEYLRTTEIVARRLPPAPAVVADIGGGPGRYALWLASLGYRVEHRDLMPLHVRQLSDASVDAVLLLGPLYHLAQWADRIAALREAGRILRPGGALFAAAISRWATRVDGIVGNRIYLKYPAALELIDEAERAGVFPPLHPGAFSAYSHRPDDLRAELTAAGFTVTDLVSVEGPGMILPDLDARMADPTDRTAILDAARAIERIAELIGFGPHLLGTAIANPGRGPGR